MGCGCKKNKTNTVQQPAEISLVNEQVSTQQNSNLTLTEEQQKTVDEIIARLNQVSQ